MKKNQRKAQAEETVAICEQGHYQSTSGVRVDIAQALAYAKAGTRCHDLATMPPAPAASSSTPTEIEVTSETTFAALQRLRAEGRQRLGCLNFASAKNPGGGFLNGAEAQEEALSRASALVACLITEFGSYYQRNRSHTSCLYLDLAIVSPRVPFFRDDEGLLLDEPLLATVVTSPAPNAGAVTANEPLNVAEIVPTLRRRSEQVLRAAALAGIKSLVLGAWGCGVFRNDPTNVAAAFADLLGPAGPYHHHFERVTFAVYDPSPGLPKVAAFHNALFHQPCVAD